MRPGIVDLRDLVQRYAWHPRAIAGWLAAVDLVAMPGDPVHRFAPPRVVVVIVPSDQPELMTRSQAWLADAAHVVVVRDGRPPAAPVDPQAWATVLAALPGAELFDWGSDDWPCHAAIRKAIALSAGLAPARVVTPQPVDRELPSGPWIATDPRPISPLALLASRLETHGDAVILRGSDGVAADLATPPRTVPLAMTTWPAHDRFHQPGFIPLGRDPVHPVRWRGHRMMFFWSYAGSSGEGFLSATDHDWPCGPAKKLYGYEDNDPVQICLTPAADACLARFDHDVLLTTAVPIAWRRVTGEAGELDVAGFDRDRLRAVFYARGPAGEYPHAPDIDPLDEDARDLAPVVVLGPDARIRYAIDLGAMVFRIWRPTEGEAEAVRVGGPDEGYAVCDAEHRIVRRGSGRLLGGWYRWATIEDAGAYWREDLATGERTRLAPVDLAECCDPDCESVARDAVHDGHHDLAAQIHATYEARPIDGADHRVAVAIPGTRNVLLVATRALRVL